MIGDLVSEIQNTRIILDPNFQRNYIWDTKKASLLIESILLNIPIPALYASENEEGKWDVVDGVQRLTALARYMDDQYKLSGLETLEELNGKKFSQLTGDIQMRISRGELRLIVLQNDSDAGIKFDIFMRLNSGSVRLNEQELRNCLYRGTLNECIKDIVSKNKDLKKIAPDKSARMGRNELILRYLAVSQKYNKSKFKIEGYDGRIKNLINSFMSINKDLDENDLNDLRLKFETQINKVFEIFGERAFKQNAKTTKINSSVYECIMIAFEEFNIEELIEKKQSIIDMHEKLLEDPDFLSSITKATGNTENLNYRIMTYIKALRNIVYGS